VKDDLKKQLLAEQTADYLYNLGIRIQDSLAGGNTLEEVAKVMGLKVEKIKGMTHNGTSISGAALPIPKMPKFIEAAFTPEKPEDAQLVENQNGPSYVLRVDEITPARVRALDEVRALVTEAYVKETQENARRKAAEDIALKVQKGESTLEKEAKALGLKLETTKPITRSNSGYNMKLPPALITEAFSLTKKEDATAAYRSEEGDYILGSLTEIIPVPPLVEGKEMEPVSKKLKQQTVNESFTELGGYLYEDYKVSVNNKLLNRMYGNKEK
jgi:peptidyl-prolyl cis-trans isomerase D